MRTPLETSFQFALDEAKTRLERAFAEEREKVAGDGVPGVGALFIALQNRSQDVSVWLVDRMLDAVERQTQKADLDDEEAQSEATRFFDQFTQFVVQTYEAENVRQFQTRRGAAPLIHSSLFHIPRQRLSAGLPERMARKPMSGRFRKLFGVLRSDD